MELLRFLAALAVLGHHYYLFSEGGIGTPPLHDALPAAGPVPIGSILFQLGRFGVQFFWLLSGFIFFAQYAHPIADRSVTAAKFTALRFSRLYPLHLVTLVTVLVLQMIYAQINPAGTAFRGDPLSVESVLSHLTMTSGWLADSTEPRMNLPAWSVSIEVLVYLVFFLAMRFYPRTTTVAACLSPLALLTVRSVEEQRVLLALTLFFVGGAVFYLHRALLRLGRAVRAAIGVTLLVTAAGSAAPTLGSLAASNFTAAPAGTGVALLPALVLIVAAAAVLPQLPGRVGRAAQHLGSTTYASYLLHFPILLAIVTGYTAAGLPVPWEHNWALLGTWVALTYLAAVIVYRTFEMPAQAWIRAQFPSTRR